MFTIVFNNIIFYFFIFFFFQAEDGIRDRNVTGVQTCALPIFAALGWVADTQTRVVSDVRDLVPGNLKALKDAETLQNTTNVSGEIDVMVRAKDLTKPSVIAWMLNFQQGALCAHGYEAAINCPKVKLP